MVRAYGFSSTPIALSDGEAASTWELGLASSPLEGYISDFMAPCGYARPYRASRGGVPAGPCSFSRASKGISVDKLKFMRVCLAV